MLLAVQLSAAGDLWQADGLARETLSGWVMWKFFLASSMHDGEQTSVLLQISFVAESHCVHVTFKMQLFLLSDQSFLLPLG